MKLFLALLVCAFRGHRFETIRTVKSLGIAELRCTRCRQEWAVMPSKAATLPLTQGLRDVHSYFIDTDRQLFNKTFEKDSPLNNHNHTEEE